MLCLFLEFKIGTKGCAAPSGLSPPSRLHANSSVLGNNTEFGADPVRDWRRVLKSSARPRPRPRPRPRIHNVETVHSILNV